MKLLCPKFLNRLRGEVEAQEGQDSQMRNIITHINFEQKIQLIQYHAIQRGRFHFIFETRSLLVLMDLPPREAL